MVINFVSVLLFFIFLIVMMDVGVQTMRFHQRNEGINCQFGYALNE